MQQQNKIKQNFYFKVDELEKNLEKKSRFLFKFNFILKDSFEFHSNNKIE